jgi:ABC-2 type transport system permease protein
MARIVPRTELANRSRPAVTAFIILTQVSLYVVLWRALYADVDQVAGLDVDQAVTYSTLATLVGTTRVILDGRSSESIPARIQDGSIAFWFTRPLSARRYCAWRGAGESAYATAWTLAGLGFGIAAGIVTLPPSPGAALPAAVSYVLGQAVLYQLALIVDLTGFWTLTTYGISRLYAFAQTLLSGALIPLWFFPSWARTVSMHLPFAAGINTPVSFYAGRLTAADAGFALTEQAAWFLALSAISRTLWNRAARRLLVLGG